MSVRELPLDVLCGQLLLGGFAGTELSASYRTALGRGHRAGAILFRRNLGDLEAIWGLTRSLTEAAGSGSPPFVAVDQEGGRVARLGAPVLGLPPMRVLGRHDDVGLTRRAAEQLGRELGALGFNLDFAPVTDVDSNPDNPIIGDRAFGSDAEVVSRHAEAFIAGLQAVGVLACAKHFPGHGDTIVDSHLELPVVAHGRERLAAVELRPFRAASAARVAAMMTAHVVYRALDPTTPATFSRAICSRLLREELGFTGVLFSDDLEMGAVSRHQPIEQAAVAAVGAGCDVLLVCSDEALGARAHEALVRRAEGDEAFRERCREAARRSLGARLGHPPRPASDPSGLREVIGGAAARKLGEQIAMAARRAEP
jgi:beta-N-acetylhexosaminidase